MFNQLLSVMQAEASGSNPLRFSNYEAIAQRVERGLSN